MPDDLDPEPRFSGSHLIVAVVGGIIGGVAVMGGLLAWLSC